MGEPTKKPDHQLERWVYVASHHQYFVPAANSRFAFSLVCYRHLKSVDSLMDVRSAFLVHQANRAAHAHRLYFFSCVYFSASIVNARPSSGLGASFVLTCHLMCATTSLLNEAADKLPNLTARRLPQSWVLVPFYISTAKRPLSALIWS